MMRCGTRILTLTTLVGYLALTGHAPTWAQSLSQTLVQTYTTNPRLASARADLRAIAEALPQARAGFLPSVSVNATEGRSWLSQRKKDEFATGSQTDKFNETLTDRSIGLNVGINLYEGGQTQEGLSSAEAEVAAAIASLEAIENEILLEAATAYAGVILYRALLALSQQDETDLMRLKKQTDRQFVGRLVTLTDVAQVDSALAQARVSKAGVMGVLRETEAQYRSVVGSAPGNLSRMPSLPPIPRNLEEAQTTARRDNPELESARQSVRESEYTLRSQKGLLLPSVDAYLSYTHERDKSRFTDGNDYTEFDYENTWRLGISLSVPLYEGGTNYSLIRQASEELVGSRSDLVYAETQVIATTSAQWELLASTRDQLTSAKAQVVAARQALDGFHRLLRDGLTDMQNVLIAQRNVIDAIENQRQAEHDLFVYHADLLAALGRFTTQGLGLPVKPYDPNEYVEAVRYKLIGTKVE